MKTKTIPKDFFNKDDSVEYRLVEEGEFGVFLKKINTIYTQTQMVFFGDKRQRLIMMMIRLPVVSVLRLMIRWYRSREYGRW